MNKHITEYLDYYVGLKNPQYAVLLKGNWGSGKTFFIKNLIKKWKSENVDASDDVLILKPLYVSLNGISKTSTINQKLRAEINPILYSKGAKVAKAAVKLITKAAFRVDLDADGDDKKDGSVSFDLDALGIFNSNTKNVKGKRILIFDDVERCNITTDEIFGYVNNFVEHLECKVIILTDEQKIIDKYENEKNQSEQISNLPSYKDFKEKLIGQTFEVESNIEGAIDFFISESEAYSKNNDLSKNRDLIVSIFKASELKNLRVLKQGLFDFGRFITNVSDEFKSKDNYEVFVKNLIFYFILVYAELKTGNDNVKNFQSFMELLNNEDLSINETKLKYQPIMTADRIMHSAQVFPLEHISSYIETGHIASETFNEILRDSYYFKEVTKQQSWEELWRWPMLQDGEFKVLKDKVWRQFYDGKIKDVRILFHITGTLLELITEGLLNKTERYVKIRAKQTLDAIFRRDVLIKKYDVFNVGNGAFQKEYRSYRHPVFQELKVYFFELLQKSQMSESNAYIESVFMSLNAENIDDIYSKVKEALPDGTNVYERTAFLKQINGKTLAQKIKTFDNFTIRRFGEFINYRYFPERTYANSTIEPYHKEELDFIQGLKDGLLSKRRKREKLKNRALDKIDESLTTIIERLRAE